jgi:probable rRNA maturation factor
VWLGERGEDIQMSVAVVGDCRMAELAETYAGRRYRTDVFAFELTDEGEPIRSAQIVLNAALARAVATRTRGSAAGELAMYLIHGLLHLCGYDDHDDDQACVMHRRGMDYLRLLGYRITPAMESLTQR